jgi:hypothetical protein
VASFIGLALSPDSTPFVAFLDTVHGNKVTVMKGISAIWNLLSALQEPILYCGEIQNTLKSANFSNNKLSVELCVKLYHRVPRRV